MGRKHKHHKKKYLSVTDRPIFKILGSLLTAITFVLLYYLIVIVMERPGISLICSVPCVLLLVWIAIKQRNFWWIWLVAACPCVVLMLQVSHPVISFVLETVYWVMTLAMCLWLIFAPSRARSRAIMRKKNREQHRYTNQPAEPRAKDEWLEKLFADAESE